MACKLALLAAGAAKMRFYGGNQMVGILNAIDDAFTLASSTDSTATFSGSIASNVGGSDTVTEGMAAGWVPAGWAANSWADSGIYFSNGTLVQWSFGGTPTYPIFQVSDVFAVMTEKGGQVLLKSDGTFTYSAPVGFKGVDTFDYLIIDEAFQSDLGHVSLYVGVPIEYIPDPLPVDPPPAIDPPVEIPVVKPNIAPVAVDDSFSALHGKQITGKLLGNDYDPDGTGFKAVAGTFTDSSGGTLSISETGDFVYTPADHFVGLKGFVYDIVDVDGATAHATASFESTNTDAVASDYVFVGKFGQKISGDVTATDWDADGDAISIVNVTPTANGTLTMHADGTFDYVPKAGFYGVDSFEYVISDGFGPSDIGLVSIKVEPPEHSQFGTIGNDSMAGTRFDDTFYANAGDDLATGAGGNDTGYGGDGRDSLFGNAGNDRLMGDAGKDSLDGGDGDDYLDGGLHGDKLTGGAGADKFVLGRTAAADYDRITDFATIDQFVVEGDDFGLAEGVLPDRSYFGTQGSADVRGHGRFVYNANSKSLFWDSGEAGKADDLLVAFANKVTITASDFDIV
jgi:Ca2+-binding RTX toxin-like protein